MRLLNILIGKNLMGRKLFLGCLMISWLSSCSSVEVTDYKDTTPTLVLESFFNGPLKASGVVHDFSGKVIRKFNVTIEANWQGSEGVINEWFVYDDGETQTRVWKIKALGNGQYTGTAGDILGTALGQSSGSALRWKYDMLLPVDGDEYQVHFDDWMFLVNDNTIINQSDIIKFGVTVAQVTLVIQK
ncbi:DUF3833 domain-containing protein [Shewanella glacialipiscicola]|uniref:DUF3833 domain-containing protein n=1 Tax=Shewanella glacialipiscicola TaxID=614069 RepID=UPI001BC608BD|nr:DUF3833 domain-containing protein [Shewanella glacialipiscicola]MCL1086549.1 DUF3833 domain-containing protein [Shewanella glacialipiscicola]GIU05442.1 hypothetical protein TUM4636_05920 [Shewanella glacialipiscicola]